MIRIPAWTASLVCLVIAVVAYVASGEAPQSSGSAALAQGAGVDGEAPPSPPALDLTSPWASPSACEVALRRGDRASRRSRGLRLGTWNVRWFPDGRAGAPAEGEGTSVSWLACVIAWMDVDALAVQEWVTHLRGRQATLDLLERLETLTGHPWQHALDDCPDDGRQHLGLLWDVARVEVRAPHTLPRLNPGRSGCQHRLRPGFTATLRREGGREVQLVVVHLDSGVQARDRANRRASVRYLARLEELLPPGPPDRGVVLLGDFNTMGCSRCPEGMDGPEEVDALVTALADGAPPLARPASVPSCSSYYRGRGSLLDHVFVGGGLDPATARLELHGTCDLYRCRHVRGPAAEATRRLSDHCPLVLELEGS